MFWYKFCIQNLLFSHEQFLNEFKISHVSMNSVLISPKKRIMFKLFGTNFVFKIFDVLLNVFKMSMDTVKKFKQMFHSKFLMFCEHS